MKVVIMLLAAILLLSAPAEASHRVRESGIKGKVEGIVCEWNRRHTKFRCDDEYIQTRIIVKTLGNQVVTEFDSTDRGRFEVVLPPGQYRLVDPNGKNIVPGIVFVEEERFTRLKLFVNSNVSIQL